MEAKIIPFRHPGQERRRLSIFLAVLAALALVLAFFVVDGGRNWDRVRRFFSYGTEKLQVSLDTSAGALGELDGRLVTAGADGITLYDKEGKVSFLAAASLTNPVVQTGGGYILAYDAGGTAMLLLDGKGEIRREESFPGAVYDADLTEDGYLCYVSAGSAVKSELQLLDREQRSVFAVHAATRYFTGCAAAPGGGAVCAVSLEERDGAVSSVAVVYRTDREDPVAEVDLGNQVIFDLRFWGKSRICALGEEELLILNTKGEILGRYDASGVMAVSYTHLLQWGTWLTQCSAPDLAAAPSAGNWACRLWLPASRCPAGRRAAGSRAGKASEIIEISPARSGRQEGL